MDVAQTRSAENIVTRVTLLLNRGTVEDLSLWKRVAPTPWKASLVMDFPRKLLRLTSSRDIFNIIYVGPACGSLSFELKIKTLEGSARCVHPCVLFPPLDEFNNPFQWRSCLL